MGCFHVMSLHFPSIFLGMIHDQEEKKPAKPDDVHHPDPNQLPNDLKAVQPQDVVQTHRTPPKKPKEGSSEKPIAVLVMGCSRPDALKRSITQLLKYEQCCMQKQL